jgi:hypothetical protein
LNEEGQKWQKQFAAVLPDQPCGHKLSSKMGSRSPRLEIRTFTKATKHRNDIENLFLCIDLDPTQLLADTVTDLLLTRQQEAHSQRLRLKTSLDTESEYAAIVPNGALQTNRVLVRTGLV